MSETGRSPTITTIYRGEVELPVVVMRLSPPGVAPFEVQLGLEALTIGSHEGADIVLPDASVSREHARVVLSQRGVELTDLGSKNGTFVNGVRIDKALIAPAQSIHFGRTAAELGVGSSARVAISSTTSFGAALGGALCMRSLFARLARAAESDATVLLLGESGTGKELLARAIHDNSARRGGPFVVLDCSALAPSLLEAEIFGHARGAFTGAVNARPGLFEQAHGGTLFIDEIGELPLGLQPKLLRAIESRQVRRVGDGDFQTVDVRLVAATHRDVRAKVAAGEFREDLYYRLAVVDARVPPLRERKEDIPLLVQKFLADHGRSDGMTSLPANTLALLSAHDWPGNVRELRNTVARLVLFPDAPEQAIAVAPPMAAGSRASLYKLQLREARALVVEQFEKSYIESKLAEHSGNVTHAAAAMGVSRQFLHRLLERHGVGRDPA